MISKTGMSRKMVTLSSRRRAILGAVGIALAGGYLHLHAAPPLDPYALHPQAGYAQTPSGSAPPAVSGHRALLDAYCVTCHNERRQTAGLMFDKIDLAGVGAHAELWETVVRKLRAGAMPPAGARRPDKASLESLVAWLEDTLDRAVAANTPPRRPVVHRLNRLEYTNAIRDLLALEVDGSSLLPVDDSGYGFDNIADVLSVAPAMLDRYLLAAQKISRLAVGDRTMRATRESYRVSPYIVQQDRVSDQLPFMSRGGTVIRHYFPVDGEYVVRILLQRRFGAGTVNGVDKREQLDVRLDGARIKLFSVGGECVGSTEPKCIPRVSTDFPHTDYELTADEGLEVRFPVKAGPRLVGIAFARRNTAQEGAGPERLSQGSTDLVEKNPMGVDRVEIEGPFNATGPGDTPSWRKIFVCQPTGASSEASCAEKILATLARRSYRRPVTDRDVQRLLGFYRMGRSQGSFEAGIQFALERLLVSPNFLLRIEGTPSTDPPRTASRLSDVELASRLSFFLWSSIPDDTLLDVATRGLLSDSTILEQQVRRMLGDPRATSLVTSFASQWLYLRNMAKVAPDPYVFSDFDDSLREAFQRETELFLESQLREDHSVVDLLTANYTFVNERLARFYGIRNVYGNHFRRVTITDPNRAGLLGHASVLTVTSYSTRTSPVLRGKWLLTNILGTPPTPPPPNVEGLPDATREGERPTSLRARMEAHRNNPVCAQCHSQMDPLGFALENFNAIGKWRTTDRGVPIDPSGAFPDKTTFSDPAEFRQVLLGHRDQYVRTLTEKLLTYALGRGVEYYDMPVLRAIIRDAAPEYRWSSLILGIVKSAPFQGRRPGERDHEPVKRVN